MNKTRNLPPFPPHHSPTFPTLPPHYPSTFPISPPSHQQIKHSKITTLGIMSFPILFLTEDSQYQNFKAGSHSPRVLRFSCSNSITTSKLSNSLMEAQPLPYNTSLRVQIPCTSKPTTTHLYSTSSVLTTFNNTRNTSANSFTS